MSDREHAVRARAHQLWEQAGRPHGRDHDHWLQAEAEIAAAEAVPPAPVEDISAIGEDEGAPAPAKPKARRGSKVSAVQPTEGKK